MNFLDVIFPRWCIGCGKRLMTGERHLCLHCMMELPRTCLWLKPSDNKLAEMFYVVTGVRISNVAAFLKYQSDDISGRMVKTFKYRGKPELARYCGELMASEIQPSGFFDGIDAVVPVPLTWKRKLWRGYNQSEKLSRGISKVTGIPVCTDLLNRLYFHDSQTHFSKIDRIENVSGSFSINTHHASQYRGKHILLVDDVITVGATAKACCDALAAVPDLTVSILGFATATDFSIHL